MVLSEAIRLGAMLSPQGFDGWMDKEPRCALGAACDAVGLLPEASHAFGRAGIPYTALMARFPILNERALSPVGGSRMTISGIVSLQLNDSCHWTRERIADWVETVEAAQEAHVAAPVTVDRVIA